MMLIIQTFFIFLSGLPKMRLALGGKVVCLFSLFLSFMNILIRFLQESDDAFKVKRLILAREMNPPPVST